MQWVNCIDYKSHISEFNFKKKEVVVRMNFWKNNSDIFLIHHSTDSQFQLEYFCDKILGQTK